MWLRQLFARRFGSSACELQQVLPVESAAASKYLSTRFVYNLSCGPSVNFASSFITTAIQSHIVSFKLWIFYRVHTSALSNYSSSTKKARKVSILHIKHDYHVPKRCFHRGNLRLCPGYSHCNFPLHKGQFECLTPPSHTLVLISWQHGFSRSSGWLFLIIFCLARLIGPAMNLAEIKYPEEAALYEGSAILNNIGFSPLTLAALGLLSRLLDSINKSHNTIIKPNMLRIIELVVVVGLILGIVGGVETTFCSNQEIAL